MTNIIINTKNHTIEMNKTVTKAASRFGTPEYNELQEVRRAYPTYRVVTVAKKAAKPEYKGLTFKYMEKYIVTHDDEDKSIMAEYLMLRGMNEEGKQVDADSADYADIKDWFLQSFPAIKKYHDDRKDLLDRIALRKEQERAAKQAA